MSAVDLPGPFAVGQPVKFTQQGRDEGKWGTITSSLEVHPKLGYVLTVKWEDIDEPGVCPVSLLKFMGGV